MHVVRGLVPCLGLVACFFYACSGSSPGSAGKSEPPDAATPPVAAANEAGAENLNSAILDRAAEYLVGDFDNRAQVAKGFEKLVERHVCPLPGRPAPADGSVRWFYVEQVEDLKDGRRDAYFTRVIEVRATASGGALSRAYKFTAAHPLASVASGDTYNGPRDGCTKPELLAKITDSSLIYRAGCDITYAAKGTDRLAASTNGRDCSIGGGVVIQTSAEIFKDGIDTQDLTTAGGEQIGDTFEFRRILNWSVPTPPNPNGDAGTTPADAGSDAATSADGGSADSGL